MENSSGNQHWHDVVWFTSEGTIPGIKKHFGITIFVMCDDSIVQPDKIFVSASHYFQTSDRKKLIKVIPEYIESRR